MGQLVDSIGPASFAGVDDAFVSPFGVHRRAGVSHDLIRLFAGGDQIRDWQLNCDEECLTPYDNNGDPIPHDVTTRWGNRLWAIRHVLESVTSFGGKTRKELGEEWWTWYRWISERVESSNRIVFAFIATHNHFFLDQTSIAFNRSAPVIMLPVKTKAADSTTLLGLLNSSTAQLLASG